MPLYLVIVFEKAIPEPTVLHRVTEIADIVRVGFSGYGQDIAAIKLEAHACDVVIY